MLKQFSTDEKDQIIEMAWENQLSFKELEEKFGLKESEVIKVMKTVLKPSSFQIWKKRVNLETKPKTLIQKLFGR